MHLIQFMHVYNITVAICELDKLDKFFLEQLMKCDLHFWANIHSAAVKETISI